jgi:multiple sugar transport system substrate-binding protein
MSAPQTPPVDDTISLTILAGEDPIIARGIEILQERFPEETFDIEHIAREGSDLREYALISMAGGEFPDVYFCDSIWMGEFVKAGFLEELPTSWLNELTGWPNDWHENTRDGMTWDNKTYGIWWDTDTRIWMYNKEFINDTQIPTTWAEEIALQEWLTAEDKPPILVYTSHWWFDYVFPLIWQGIPEEDIVPPGWGLFEEREGRLYPIFNHTAGVAALQHMVDMVEAGAFPAYSSIEGDEGHARCFEGYYSAVPGGGTWAYGEWIDLGNNATEFMDHIGYAVHPYPVGGHSGSFGGGWCWTIPKGSDNKDWAWEFIKITCENDLLVEMGKDYGMMFPRVAAMDELIAWGETPYLDVIVEQYEYSYIRPAIPEFDQFDNFLMTACSEAILGDKTPQEALDDAVEKMAIALGW